MLAFMRALFRPRPADLTAERERFRALRGEFRAGDPLVLEGGRLNVTAARLREINDLLEQDQRAI